MQRLAALPRPYTIVLFATLLALVSVAQGALVGVFTSGIHPGFADKDFANYWTAARLIWEGKAQDLFGPQPIYFAHLSAAFGPLFPWHNWSYPPHFLLLIWPLAFFGYKSAMLLFLAVTGAFFLYAYRAFIGERSLVAWVAVAPFIVHNFWVAQNGYLTAALVLGALTLRDRRPVVAGILLGIMTVKPQLGFLLPFLLLAERRWTVIASAMVTALLMVAMSMAIFGLDAWQGYIHEVLPYQTMVMRELEGTFLAMMPSFYGALRNWNVDPDTALALHFVVAAPVAVILIAALFSVKSSRDRSIIVLIGTFVVTPYALTYDLGLLAAGVGLMVTWDKSTWPRQQGRIALLAVTMMLPVVMIPLGHMKMSIAPFVVLALFFLALRDAGFTLPTSRRRARPDRVVTASSPAAGSD